MQRILVTLFAFIFVACTLLCLWIANRIAIRDANYLPRGIVGTVDELPFRLRDTVRSLRGEELLPEKVEFFRVYPHENDRIAVRFERGKIELRRFLQQLSLVEVDTSNRGIKAFQEYMPQEWSIGNVSKFYASKAWQKGDEGIMFVLGVDDRDGKLYLYYYNNF